MAGMHTRPVFTLNTSWGAVVVALVVDPTQPAVRNIAAHKIKVRIFRLLSLEVAKIPMSRGLSQALITFGRIGSWQPFACRRR